MLWLRLFSLISFSAGAFVLHLHLNSVFTFLFVCLISTLSSFLFLNTPQFYFRILFLSLLYFVTAALSLPALFVASQIFFFFYFYLICFVLSYFLSCLSTSFLLIFPSFNPFLFFSEIFLPLFSFCLLVFLCHFPLRSLCLYLLPSHHF